MPKQLILAAGNSKATLGCDFLAPFRHDTGSMRLCSQSDLHHLLGGGHFKVQWDGDRGTDVGNIGIADMPSVFAQMRGDAVRTGCLGHNSCPHRVRMRPATGVADRGHMVDIHPQSQAVRYTHSCLSPLIVSVS